MIAEAQRRGGICAFIDAEHAMDPAYAKRIGVNIDDLLVSQPDTGEQALEITELLIRSGALDVVAIDSVAALTPKAEIEGEMGDSHVGLQARLMSQALRKLAGTLNRTDTICLFTNQLREKIGVMFGNPETTPGGRALKFYSSVRLDIRRIETLKDGVEAIGNRVRVKVVKNKVAPPFKQAEFDIIYGSGISWEGTVLDAGLERKIVQKSGSYFSFGDERLGQGRQNATAFLREHPDVTQQILPAIQARASGPTRSSRRGCCRRRGDADAPAEATEQAAERRERRPTARAGRRAGVTPSSRRSASRPRPRRRRARRQRVADAFRRRPSCAPASASGGARPDRARELGASCAAREALDARAGALAPRALDGASSTRRLQRSGVRSRAREATRDARARRATSTTRASPRRARSARGARLRRRGDPLATSSSAASRRSSSTRRSPPSSRSASGRGASGSRGRGGGPARWLARRGFARSDRGGARRSLRTREDAVGSRSFIRHFACIRAFSGSETEHS